MRFRHHTALLLTATIALAVAWPAPVGPARPRAIAMS
jgi:hypothetical protein